MKMYVKPSIEVIELQLKEDIAAVPTTVYKGSKSTMGYNAGLSGSDKNLTNANSGLEAKTWTGYDITIGLS